MIYAMYAELWGKGLREELIWPELVLAFHLERDTIYRIVLKQSRIKDAASPELPLTEGKDGTN